MFYRSYKIFTLIFILTFSFSFAQRRDLVPLKTEPDNLDVKLFRAINNNRCRLLNTIIPISDKSILFTATLIPVTLFTVSRVNNNYYDENSSALLTLSEGLSIGITYGLKNIVKRKRPFENLSNVHYDGNKFLLDYYSFPSGHSAISFSIATSLTLRYPDKPVLITGVYLYSTLISFGRIYLGVHYPSDVLAGMIIGSGSAAIIHSLRKEIIKGKNNLFREQNRDDSNQKSVSVPLLFISMIAGDVVNYVIGKSMGNNLKVGFDLVGKNNVKLNLNF